MRDRNFYEQTLARPVSPLHFLLARFICDQVGSPAGSPLYNLVTALSILFEQGHLRLPVESIPEELEIYALSSPEREKEFLVSLAASLGDPASVICTPLFVPEHDVLESGVRAPFILTEGGRFVTTEKLYFLEKRFIEKFLAFAGSSSGTAGSSASVQPFLPAAAEDAVKKFEAATDIRLEDKQRQAVLKTFESNLTVIAGGPGTGKSTVIAFIIFSHLEADPGLEKKIALAAPTGRAAGRLENLPGSSLVTGRIEKPRTLHRLLGLGFGSGLNSGKGRPGKKLFLPYRMVIIDEASMLDAGIIETLLSSLGNGCRLVLVGDPHQLPAVGSGTVLADITENAGSYKHILSGRFLKLDKIKRSSGTIPAFAQGILDGTAAFGSYTGGRENEGEGNVKIKALDWENVFSYAAEKYRKLSVLAAGSPNDFAENHFSSFILLSPSNSGRFGVDNLNEKLFSFFSGGRKKLLPGMPLMILRNDYENDLFNGDRGIIVSENSALYALFINSIGEKRKIPVAMLKNWEISYVQTVHKSQGSEYESVALVAEKSAEKLLTKEILYTAVTRAKKEVVIFSDRELLECALKRKVTRYSGIGAAMLCSTQSRSPC